MIEGIPNWLAIPLAIIGIIGGWAFIGWMLEEFFRDLLPPPPQTQADKGA